MSSTRPTWLPCSIASRNRPSRMPTMCHSRGAAPRPPHSADGTSAVSTLVRRSTSVLAMAVILTHQAAALRASAHPLSADLGVAPQRFLSFLLVIDDGRWVVAALQLGHPSADVIACGSGLFALRRGVEYSERGTRVGARAGAPLPAV